MRAAVCRAAVAPACQAHSSNPPVAAAAVDRWDGQMDGHCAVT